MERKITEHPIPPTAPNGAIDIWSERERAVSMFRLTAAHGSDPPVEVYDLDSHDAVDGLETLQDVADQLGPVVFPDLAAYRAGTGWRLPAVLGALGVDAAELYEEDLADTWAEMQGTGLATSPRSYDFSRLPPVGAYMTDEQGDERVFTADEHAAAWAAFMLETDPDGYALWDAGSQGWQWRRPGDTGFKVPTSTETNIEIAAALQKELAKGGIVGVEIGPKAPDHASARAAAWADALDSDAEVVVDLLGIVSVWPDSYSGEGGLWPAEASDMQAIDRRRWVSGWTLLERGQVVRWAAATHVAASDNDDVEIPPRPACLDRSRPT